MIEKLNITDWRPAILIEKINEIIDVLNKRENGTDTGTDTDTTSEPKQETEAVS